MGAGAVAPGCAAALRQSRRALRGPPPGPPTHGHAPAGRANTAAAGTHPQKTLTDIHRDEGANPLNAVAVIFVQTQKSGHAGTERIVRDAASSSSTQRTYLSHAVMRDVHVPDSCTKMFDMSIQEVNGKGPKKRKKSLERICDNDGRERSELNVGEEGGAGKHGVLGEEMVAGAGGAAGARVGGVELLHWRDMPHHLQFNPYVLTGYRPLQSWTDCVRSLFYFHNETINIFTHGNYICTHNARLAAVPSSPPYSCEGKSCIALGTD